MARDVRAALEIVKHELYAEGSPMLRHGLEAADVAAILKLKPRLLLGGVLSFSRLEDLAASSDVENANDGGRNRCGRVLGDPLS